MQILTHFRHSKTFDVSDEMSKFMVCSPLTGEEYVWTKIDEYPAEEFLVDEALAEDTMDKCCEYALRWLLEQDDIRPADFLFLSTDYGSEGMFVIKEDSEECKKMKNFLDCLPSVGMLSGTPYIVKRFSAYE